MNNLNTDRELHIDDLEAVAGGSSGINMSFFGNDIHFGTDQTGAPYVSWHGSDGHNVVIRGEPK
jgi:hypothetical protein